MGCTRSGDGGIRQLDKFIGMAKEIKLERI